MIVGFKATLRQGGGRWGGGGGGGGVTTMGGFNCLWSWRTVRLRTPVSQEGYPFEAKKRGPKKGFGEDLEGGACSDNLYTSGPRPRRIWGFGFRVLILGSFRVKGSTISDD